MIKQGEHFTAVILDTDAGSWAVPTDSCGEYGEDQHLNKDDEPNQEAADQFLPYTEGNDLYEIARKTGFFSRLSMPGYLDCTEWHGPFDTERKAAEYLEDIYGD